MKNSFQEQMIVTLVGIAVFLFLMQPMALGGVVAIIFLPIWLLYTLINGISLRKQPRLWLTKLLCWLAAFAVLYAMHHVHNRNARIYAQKIADELNAYHAQHGRYPPQEIWQSQHRPRQYFLLYICLEECEKNQRPPIFMYSSSLNSFDRYVYDFKRQEWEHKPD